MLLTDVEGSLWPKELIEGSRVPRPLPASGERESYSRIVIGVDPPASVSGTCGIVVCGLDPAARGVVLHDASVAGQSPEGWARAVADAAAAWHADRVVVERNQGGDMVMSVLRAAQAKLPIRAVHASRGKAARAEPVAALFESGRAVFDGVFPELEAELSGLQIAGGYTGPGMSPDRADAMVLAMWADARAARRAAGADALGYTLPAPVRRGGAIRSVRGCFARVCSCRASLRRAA